MTQASSTPAILPPKTFLPELTDRYSVAGGRLEVSPFCIGIVDDPNVIPEAFDAGINFFFITADMHWPLYDKTRRGLELLFERGGGVRDEVAVGIVCYATQPEFCIAPFAEVVDVVKGLEKVDVAIAGGAYSHEITNRLAVYHQRHQREAYLDCRAIGTTFHDRKAALVVANHEMVDFSFIRYSAAHPGARNEIFPYLNTEDRSLIYNFKSMGGFVDPAYFDQLGFEDHHWKPKPTDHYRFVLSRPEIDGLLCALTKTSMIQELADAMDEGPLDEEEEIFLMNVAYTAREKASGLIPVNPDTGKPVYY